MGGGGAPHSPEMARAVFAVINHWAEIENSYSLLLANIARADPVTITAVYQAMANGDARRAALIAAAKASTKPEVASLIQATMEASKASREQRNSFAHHVWGILNTRTDVVLLMHPKDLATYSAKTTAWIREATTEYPEHPTERPPFDRSLVMVWNLKDFEKAEALALLRYQQTGRLPFLLNNHPSAPSMRAKLLEDRQIARLYEQYLRENTR
jgi:hypothetical protein